MKKIVSFVLVGVLLATTASSALYAAPKNSNAIKNRSKNQIEVVKQEEMVVKDVRDKLRMMVEHSDGTFMNLPPGLAKRGPNNLPPGLQKQLERGRFPSGLTHGKTKDDDQESTLPAIEKALLILEGRIELAEMRLENYDKKLYVEDTFSTLENAVKRATNFYDAYKNEHLKAIQYESNLLNEAIKVFDDSEILNKLKALKIELEAYKARYFPEDDSQYENNSHFNALVALIQRIEGYTKAGSEQILTKGTYDEMIKLSKSFGDHLKALENMIDQALETLYEDPKAETLTYKHQEGNTVGLVLPGSREALKTAIEAAQKFVKGYDSFDHTAIYKAENDLSKAIATYEGNMVLGSDD